MSAKRVLEIGSKYGKLTVVRDVGVINRRSYYECLCDCGSMAKVQTKKLATAHTRSCGCLKLEMLADRSTTHGMSHLPEYGVWQDIKKRCFNPKHKFFDYYGGRGITMHATWVNSFENFYSDMGARPFEGAEVDREDNAANYTPDNCRWVTRTENMRNTRFNKIIEHNGVRKCLAEWAELYNVKQRTLWDRINSGWDIARALTEPIHR